MSIFKEIPPTAGFPFFPKDLLSLCSRPVRRGEIEDDFRKYLGAAYARLTCSGTAALWVILETLKELSAKRTVVIPSYLCPLVPLAVKRAGLKLEVCDINPEDFNFNASQLKRICRQPDILAVIPAHLGGIPLDLSEIRRIASQAGIFIIEDCAQSLGAQYRGRNIGRDGDFAFFSLARGKGLTIYEGGMIICNKKEYAAALDKKASQLLKDAFLPEALKILELFGYWIFYRPQLFWFVFGMPQLFWRVRGRGLKALGEEFSIDFPVHKVSAFRRKIAHCGFHRLEEEIAGQRQKAEYFIGELKGCRGLKVLSDPPDGRASYPFVVLLFDDPAKRDRVFSALQHSGLGVSFVYALAINEYDYLKKDIAQAPLPAGASLAKRQLSLSTNRFLKKSDQVLLTERIKSFL